MPELPEVETLRRQLECVLPNKKIKECKVVDDRLRFPIEKKIEKEFAGRTITSVERVGKYLEIKFDASFICLVHLGMTGRLTYVTDFDKLLQTPDFYKYLNFYLVFTDKSALTYCDVRRFGFIQQIKTDELEKHLPQGLEPLSASFSYNYLLKLTLKSKQIIKNFLLDQKKIAGLGNIYVCETLFLSQIHPHRIANTLTNSEIELLVHNIKNVLRKAVEKGGSSISDFLKTDGTRGSYQDHFLVYNKEGQECKVCGAIIERIKTGSRSSFLCPQCQI